MTKEEKAVVINNLAEQLNEYPHFYLTDIETLNAEQTAQLRRKCFENEIKLVVVKNTLFGKALEKAEKADADLMKVLEGSTSVMFATTAKAPAVVIKEFRKKSEKPVLKAETNYEQKQEFNKNYNYGRCKETGRRIGKFDC